MYTSLTAFYKSKEWEKFLKVIKAERMNESGLLICEYCGQPMVKAYDIIGHHKEPLTMSNVNDSSVSLNPVNVQLVHHRCHNKIHNRFGLYQPQRVYIVWGSPLSGKTTYVKQNKTDRDIVVDMDSLWQAVTMGERYIKNNYLKANVFGVRDALLDQIKTRRGQWQTAYVIGGYPSRGERERLADRLQAELIHIDTDKETCLRRLHESPGERDIEAWAGYIEKYFGSVQL